MGCCVRCGPSVQLVAVLADAGRGLEHPDPRHVWSLGMGFYEKIPPVWRVRSRAIANVT